MVMKDEATEDNFEQFPSGSGGGIFVLISSKKQDTHHKYYYLDAVFLKIFFAKEGAQCTTHASFASAV